MSRVGATCHESRGRRDEWTNGRAEWHGKAHFEPRKYRTIKCAYLYCVEERNFEDAKYMREDIDGRAIFDQLSDARSDVEMYVVN